MNLKIHAGVKNVDDNWTAGITNDEVVTTGDNHWSGPTTSEPPRGGGVGLGA